MSLKIQLLRQLQVFAVKLVKDNIAVKYYGFAGSYTGLIITRLKRVKAPIICSEVGWFIDLPLSIWNISECLICVPVIYAFIYTFTKWFALVLLTIMLLRDFPGSATDDLTDFFYWGD